MGKTNENKEERGEAPKQMRSPSVKQMLTECLDLGRQTFEKLGTVEELVEIIAREIARQIGPKR